jgi:hypothetical protein
MSNEAWMVSSGEYSDYSVWCVFEREEDARSYARHVNESDIRSQHDKAVADDYTPPNAHLKCVGSVEDCPSCGKYWEELDHDGWSCRVERVQWWPAGVVPVREAVEASR